MSDLFSDAASQRAGEVAPLAQRLRPRALEEFVVEGIHTTIPFHLELLADPSVRSGDYHVEFLEQRGAASGRIAT